MQVHKNSPVFLELLIFRIYTDLFYGMLYLFLARKNPTRFTCGVYLFGWGFVLFYLLVGFLVGCFANCQNISQIDVLCCSVSSGALSQQSPSLFQLKNCMPEWVPPSMLLYSIIYHHQFFLKFKLMYSNLYSFSLYWSLLRIFPHR